MKIVMKKIILPLTLICALIAPTQVHPIEAETYKKILPWSIGLTAASGLGAIMCHLKEKSLKKKSDTLEFIDEEIEQKIKNYRTAKLALGALTVISGGASVFCWNNSPEENNQEEARSEAEIERIEEEERERARRIREIREGERAQRVNQQNEDELDAEMEPAREPEQVEAGHDPAEEEEQPRPAAESQHHGQDQEQREGDCMPPRSRQDHAEEGEEEGQEPDVGGHLPEEEDPAGTGIEAHQPIEWLSRTRVRQPLSGLPVQRWYWLELAGIAVDLRVDEADQILDLEVPARGLPGGEARLPGPQPLELVGGQELGRREQHTQGHREKQPGAEAARARHSSALHARPPPGSHEQPCSIDPGHQQVVVRHLGVAPDG